MERHGRQHQRGCRDSDRRRRALRLRPVAYRVAWLYICAWITELSLGRLPHPVEVASLALAVAALLLIVAVLIEPRPTRAGGPRAALDVPPLGLDYVDPRDHPRTG